MSLEERTELALGRKRYSKEVELHEQRCGNRNLLTCDMKGRTRPGDQMMGMEGQQASAQLDNRGPAQRPS